MRTSGSTCPTTRGSSFVRDAAAHHAAMTLGAAYYVETEGRGARPGQLGRRSRRDGRAGSRCTRRFDRWAATASRSSWTARSDHARRFAEELRGEPGVRVLNDVVLNQVLVRFEPADDAEARRPADRRGHRARSRRTAPCWLGGTTWHGRRAMRISVSGWMTETDDVERSIDAILRAARSTPTG